MRALPSLAVLALTLCDCPDTCFRLPPSDCQRSSADARAPTYAHCPTPHRSTTSFVARRASGSGAAKGDRTCRRLGASKLGLDPSTLGFGFGPRSRARLAVVSDVLVDSTPCNASGQWSRAPGPSFGMQTSLSVLLRLESTPAPRQVVDEAERLDGRRWDALFRGCSRMKQVSFLSKFDAGTGAAPGKADCRRDRSSQRRDVGLDNFHVGPTLPTPTVHLELLPDVPCSCPCPENARLSSSLCLWGECALPPGAVEVDSLARTARPHLLGPHDLQSLLSQASNKLHYEVIRWGGGEGRGVQPAGA